MTKLPSYLALLAFFLFAGMGGSLRAADEAATAALSSATAAVGEPVRLEINVTGARNLKALPEIELEGVVVQYNGASSRVEMSSYSGITSSTMLTFTLIPQREGKFTIPALSINVGKKTVTTQPLMLTVSGHQQPMQQAPTARGRARSRAQLPLSEPLELDKLAFAEWVLPKTTAYVGETVPAELRIYLAANIRWQMPQLPIVTGDGFVIQKFPRQPKITDVTRDGQPFKLIVFKTAVTAAKAGKLTLAPAEITTVAQLPRRHARPQMPGFDDIFNDPFFNSVMMAEQEVPIRSESMELEIKPLPAVGKPKGFSGAVGQFTFETKAAPLTVRVGDPVTVTADVAGFGSFDRMGPPVVEETPGWKAYPPSSKFASDDEASISGTKTFEMAVIPDRPQTTLPKIEFSYFDPSLEKYVTLAGEPIVVKVDGTALPTPTPSIAASGPAAVAPETPKANDIQFIRLDSGAWGRSFEPLWKQRAFLATQAVPLLALLLLAGWRIRQLRAGDVGARRIAELRSQKQAANRVVRDATSTSAQFYEAAVRYLQLEAVLQARGALAERDPATFDADAVRSSRKVSDETAAGIREIFAAHDEIHYAGAYGGAAESAVSSDRRQAALRTLEQFDRSHA